MTVDVNPGDESIIRQAVAEFLAAFGPLDLPKLAYWMAPEITAFLPFAPGRVDGRPALVRAFEGLFVSLRQQMAGPSYLQLEADRTKVLLSEGIAVVSFELPHPSSIGHRTLVFKKLADGWRIVHAHASEQVIEA
jgi:ketosteroid isomerase-like protein